MRPPPAFTHSDEKKHGHHGGGWLKLPGWKHSGSGSGPQEAVVMGAAGPGEEKEGRAPRATLWDVAARSIMTCCTDNTTQNTSDIPRSLTTSPEGLHGLETWQYSALGMAKRARWELTPLHAALMLWRLPGPANSGHFALRVKSDLYSSPTCIAFVYFCNILKYSNIPYLGGSLEGE